MNNPKPGELRSAIEELVVDLRKEYATELHVSHRRISGALLESIGNGSALYDIHTTVLMPHPVEGYMKILQHDFLVGDKIELAIDLKPVNGPAEDAELRRKCAVYRVHAKILNPRIEA